MINKIKLFLLFCFIIFSFNSNAQLTPYFGATTSHSGYAPLSVTFHDSTTGGHLWKWHWVYGTNLTDTAATVSHVDSFTHSFATSGTYDIKMVVYDSLGHKDSFTRASFVVVKPQAKFSGLPLSGYTPLTVTFNPSITTGGHIWKFHWQFDSSNPADTLFKVQPTAFTPFTHIYTTSGTYTVKMIAYDSLGNTDTLVKLYYDTVRPKSLFTSNPQNGCASSGHPLTVHFIDASLGSHKWRWFYNFDTTVHADTSTPFISSPFHSYTIAGTYIVKQVLYDSLGNKDSSYKTVVVTPQPVVSFTTPDTLHFCPPHTVVFTNTSDTTAGCTLTFNWYIDTAVKHTTHLNQTVSYTFTQPGTYDIALTETESCNCGPSNLTKHAYIHVDSFSTPCFNTNDTSGCGAPYTVHFTNCSIGAATYLWNFGDGTSDTAANPIHIYNATNTTGYTDTLTSYSLGGCPTTKIKVHNIKVGHFNPGFQTYLNATPTVSTTVICINSSLALKDTTFGAINHHWRFSSVSGDTLNTLASSFLHQWISSGLYHVTDSSWNTTGCSGIASHDIYVPLNPIIDSITANYPYRCSPPDSVQFISWIRDTFTYSKIWHFGEPGLGNLDTAYSDSMHVYNSTGLFSPSIKVTDAYGCFSNASFPNFININSPYSAIKVTIDSGCIPYTTYFSDTVSQAGKRLNYHLDSVNYGDGTPTDIVDTGLNFVGSHTYGTVGRFNMYNYFHLDSSVGGCSYVDSIGIFAGSSPILANYLHAIPQFDSVCPHTNVRFYDFCSNCNSVSWNVSGGVFHTMDTSFIFTNFGSKFVMYVPNYNGCTDTLKSDSLYVWPPNVNFTISIPKCSSRDSFLFTNTSAPPTIGGYVYTYHYVWNFGDGSPLVSTTATTNVTHVFTADGTYSVTLTDSSSCPNYTNPHSCGNSFTFPVYVYPVLRSDSTFYATKTLACKGNNIIFRGFLTQYSTYYLSYTWKFGDGLSTYYPGNADTTYHIYASTGLYSPKLFLTTKYGCSDSITRSNYITIETPYQGLIANGLSNPPYLPYTGCSYFTVNFHDSTTAFPGTSLTKRRWYFNAAPTVTGVNTPPTTLVSGTLFQTDTTITFPVGLYHVVVIDTDNLGCFSSDTVQINSVKPHSYFTSNDTIACSHVAIHFHDTTTHVSKNWIFGDNSGIITSLSTDTFHYYFNNGLYSDTLITISDATSSMPIGCRDTAIRTNYVSIGNSSVNAGFNFIGISFAACPPLSIGTRNTSTSLYSNFYQWKFGVDSSVTTTSTNPSFTYNYPGNYTITLIDSNTLGCKDTIHNTVSIGGPTGTLTILKDTLCTNEPTLLHIESAILSPGVDTPFIWTVGYGTFSTDTQGIYVAYATAGNYHPYVIIHQLSSGCSVTVNTTDSIKVFPLPVITIPNDSICKNSSVVVNANGATAYSWSPAYGLSSTNISNPVANPTVTTTYTVIGTTNHNCKDTVFANVTVNPTPTAISGNAVICNGNSSTLSNGTTGGIWSSLNTAIAIVDINGIVTGISPGTTTISYVIGNCNSTKIVTINIQPDAISGVLSLCHFATDTLKNDTTGGVWSSSITTVATISNTGVVTGQSVGTSVISYSVGNCRSFAIITVNTLPSAISGTYSICNYDSTILTNDSAGGTWQSVNTLVATISNSGKLIGTASGTSIISYTIGNCTATKTITVHIQPDAISGTFSLCNFATDTLKDDTTGGVWSSSSTSIATINNSGIITGHAVGTSIISYSVGNCKSFAIITVNTLPSAISGIFSICNYDSTTLINDSLGGNWSSINSNVAIINNTGKYFGLLPGTSLISYTIGNCTATKTITVHIQPDAISGTFSFCNLATDTLKDDTTGGIWTSATLAVATINNNGVITGHSVGTTNITYTVGSCKSTASVTVNILPSAILGTYAICNYDSTTLINDSLGGIWSSINTSVATINNSGKYYGLLPGTSLISYTIGNCSATKTITVHVQPDAISGTFSLCNLATDTLKNDTTGGIWASATHAVATINNNGVITGHSVGTSVITYTVGSCKSTATVTVNILPSAILGTYAICNYDSTILINDSLGGNWNSGNTSVATISSNGKYFGISTGTSVITYTIGNCSATKTITVHIQPDAISGTFSFCNLATDTLKDDSTGGIWASTSHTVATINNNGVVTGHSVGTSVITYSIGSCITMATVTVNILPSAILGSYSVCNYDSTTLINDSIGGNWNSSNTNVAIINNTGKYYGISTGTSIITYTIGNCMASKTITVNIQPDAISGVFSFCNYATDTLKNDSTGGVWTSFTHSVATINSSNGVITGIGAGSSVVSYTIGNCSSSAVVTVNTQPSPIAGGATTICKYGTSTLTDIIGGGTWSSVNTNIATISNTGVVSALLPGTSLISYTLGSCFVTTTVTILNEPDSITGVNVVCVAATTTLNDIVSSGKWSCSNTALCTIDSVAGIVTGLSAGLVNISYTNTITGCYTRLPLTINAIPLPISGTPYVCSSGEGNTLLSDATIGGTWSCSETSIATIGATTGIITGVTPGTPIVTYTLSSTGCYQILPISVNTTPATITGNNVICAGSIQDLTDVTPGGFWISNTPIVASLISSGSTVPVTGVSVGTSLISYIIGNCYATTIVTVNTQPVPISGVLSICNHAYSTLIETTLGGIWSSSNTSVASINPLGGTVTAFAAGISTITYNLNNCTSIAILTVNTQPARIEGSASLCTGTSATLTDSTLSGVWNSFTPAILSVTGLGNSCVIHGIAAGTTVITYSLNSCYSILPVTVYQQPSIIVGGNSSICNYSSIHLTDSIIGGKWFSDNPTIAIADSNTGIITGSSVGSTTITYSIGNCYITNTITINTQPTPIYGYPTSICSGTSTTYYDSTISGAWFSTNPTVANISPTGEILGNTEGMSIISYTIGSCFDTALIKVTSQPSPIFGLLDICNHTSTTLSESIHGGRWSIINPSVVNVDSINTSTAVLTGISVGTSIISYVRGICYSVASITVNSQPATIGGADSVCKLSTITFLDDSLHGKWKSLNILVATVDSNTGVVKGVYAGTVQDTTSIYYTIGNCRAYKIISVNPLPIITGNDTVICKYTSGKLKVSGANKYLWSPAGSLSCNTCTNPTANPIVTTIYTITGTSVFGCISTKLLKDSVDAIGNIVFKGKDTICRGEIDTLYASGAKYFKWYPSIGLDCSICDTTHSKPDSTIIYSLVGTDSLGCHDTTTHKINVTQLAKLTSTLTPPLICTGTLFSYQDTCNIANASIRWHRNQAVGITPAISNGINGISEILYNSTLKKDTVYYTYVLNYLSCADSQKVELTVDPLPTRPIISTTSPANLCANTLYQNFGATQAEPNGVNYTWSAKNGTIWAESPGKQNCVVNFYQPGISIVKLSANIIGSNCKISDSFSVAITPSESPIINVVYDHSNFICLLNSADSFQWGYDNVNTFEPTSILGEVYQNYYNPSPDFKSNYYWVKTAKDGCSQKSYYNSPTSIIKVGIAEIQTIKVYPNPANDLITIEISGNSFNEKTIQIFNLTGKLMKSFPGINKMEVDISAFPPGFYFIGCYSNGIVNASTKFIKSVELK